MAQWNPRSPEDQLLLRYWERAGGRVYVEVPIGGPGGRGNWPAGCPTQRIDGVRFPARAGEPGILPFAGSGERFAEDLAQEARPEVIEVKVSLNRTAIGQARAGADLFEQQYGEAGRPVIVCATSDTALGWVCDKRGIAVMMV